MRKRINEYINIQRASSKRDRVPLVMMKIRMA